MDKVRMTAELIAALATMGKEELVRQWKENFDVPPHPKLRSELMRPVLAYRIQERAAGLSKQRIKRRLLDAASEANTTRFKQGTRIVREWGGKIHEVSVTNAGYEYQGEIFKSLSPIATKITGTKWSGPAFFGTKPKVRSK